MKSNRYSMSFLTKVLVFAAAMALTVFTVAAQKDKDDDELTVKHPKLRGAIAVQEEVTAQLMEDEDVLGTAVGLDDEGEATIFVYVNIEGKNPAKAYKSIPRDMKGVRALAIATEPFRAISAMPAAAAAVSHMAKQTPPIQLGTSGGWGHDLANGYCCGGTLGSLIQVNSVQYVLSNYHVFESDIVLGGNTRIAATGDPIIQPGLIDVGCNVAGAQAVVAALVKIASLPNSNVDASIAQVNPGMVQTNGSILEIGTISRQTVAASLLKRVKKSGRTTGLTRSSVVGMNGTLSVQYGNECAGGVAFTKTFTGQILIANTRAFISGGDSGSLAVEDVTTNPRAVGLLFAANSLYAIANPITQVLTFVGGKLGGTATLVGN